MNKSDDLDMLSASEDFEYGWLDGFVGLLQDETQYVTWFLVLFTCAISIIIAIVQWTKNKELTRVASHNEWVREFREKLAVLEDESLNFWMTAANDSRDVISMGRLTREVKELTTIASEIAKVGGNIYQKELFKDLRRAVTNDKENDDRPLNADHYRIISIKTITTKLRRQYKRRPCK
ncbi:hypothetical protein EH243_05175 [Amphritea opalescens]|uniref:Uncharacterized protein n=1 Tax=Amphritea opalescens TaxID=2490544 RepID=A0A430KU61_9GAMM|nr:hypothetical protein [Amphritea opalescens]RTE66988.1 hypothetical protein EH243_05175 [Amphritea opalescens]